MPIIKIKNPNYVDGSGEEKWIDAAIYTNQSNEGVEEAPNNGKDYVRRDSDWVISQKIYDELGITKQRFESLLNNAYIIPTLGAVPDETTLVYVDGEYNVNFKIGDYCRVRNTDSEYGYDFFRLYDIKDGLAVWSAAETEGSGSAGGETVLISLISNQSASDNALLGASILVYDVTADETLSETTWEGTEIILTVPKEHTYTVLVGEVSGYKTPSIKTLDAVNGATRILNMLYDCTILTVNFTSNHSADTSTATATINYDSVSLTVSSGQSVKIPYDALVNITCSKILYYKTPIITLFTAGTTTKEISAEYITSFLIVNYTKNQSVGGTPTMSVVTEGQTRSYSANMICAPGESVTINFGGITYYKTPAAITFIKGVGTETKQGDYLSEKVTCILSTNDSKVVANQLITLTCSSNSSYNKTYTCTSTATTGDSGFVLYIPYGYKYSITANNFYSYAPLTALSYTAGSASRSVTLQYIYTTYKVRVLMSTSNCSSYSIKLGNTTISTGKEYDVPAGELLLVSATPKNGYSINHACLSSFVTDRSFLVAPNNWGKWNGFLKECYQDMCLYVKIWEPLNEYTYNSDGSVSWLGTYTTNKRRYFGKGYLFPDSIINTVKNIDGDFSFDELRYTLSYDSDILTMKSLASGGGVLDMYSKGYLSDMGNNGFAKLDTDEFYMHLLNPMVKNASYPLVLPKCYSFSWMEGTYNDYLIITKHDTLFNEGIAYFYYSKENYIHYFYTTEHTGSASEVTGWYQYLVELWGVAR